MPLRINSVNNGCCCRTYGENKPVDYFECLYLIYIIRMPKRRSIKNSRINFPQAVMMTGRGSNRHGFDIRYYNAFGTDLVTAGLCLPDHQLICSLRITNTIIRDVFIYK